MNIKNNKGITLIALIITIIVILIIAGITIYNGSKLVDEAKYEDVKTNMLLIQAEIKNFVEQAKFENKKIEDFVEPGIKLDDVTLKIIEPEERDGVDYYKIETPMETLKLGNINSNQYWIAIDIDKLEVDVYFEPGISNGQGETFHYLSEIKDAEERE